MKILQTFRRVGHDHLDHLEPQVKILYRANELIQNGNCAANCLDLTFGHWEWESSYLCKYVYLYCILSTFAPFIASI